MADVTTSGTTSGTLEIIRGLSFDFWYYIFFILVAISGLIVAIVGKVNEPGLKDGCWQKDENCTPEELELKKKASEDHTALTGGIILGVGIVCIFAKLLFSPSKASGNNKKQNVKIN